MNAFCKYGIITNLEKVFCASVSWFTKVDDGLVQEKINELTT